MYAIANCHITIFRGTTTDEGGDPVPSSMPVAIHVVASIREPRMHIFSGNDTVQGNTTQTPRVIRRLTGKVGSNVDVQRHDRILLEDTGERFVVINVTTPHMFGRKPDKVLDLKQVE